MPFDYVISHPLRRWGAWGALAALIGSMVPWARQSVSFLGVEVGGSLVDAPQAMMLGLLALVGGLLVFHRYASVAVMVIGGIITLTVLLFVMQASGANPSWGLFLSGGGGAGLAYCGYQTRPPSRTS